MDFIRVWSLTALVCAVMLTGCNGCGPDVSGNDGGVDSGSGNPGPDGGEMPDPTDAGVDAGVTPVPTDPNNPNNANIDSDCDGLSDAEEFASVFPGMKKTDPGLADSDGDGISDGVELGRTTSVDTACGFAGDADPSTTTVPTEPDSDGDGLVDGIEDANRNGAFEAGETRPNDPDSDGDTLADGVEDANHNGVVDAGETDPRLKDTDGDGINDGIEKNVVMTDPTRADTDGDTCPDGAEDGNQNGVVDPGETSPLNGMDCGPANLTDADGDGLPDVVEDANGNGAYDAPGETNFQVPDTDGDGLSDGLEDKNKNGQVNAGETNPRRKDSDCDGLIDGPSQGATLGEDLNGNGIVDPGETDPTKADTDGDGVADGVERGITANPDPTGCPNVTLDANPATTTDPTQADNDGDGILDGAEDSNQNGAHDPGELDPNNGMDGMGPAGQVCTVQNLRPVVFREEGQSDVQLALPSTFTELATMTVNGSAAGIIGYDPTSRVGFLAYRRTPAGANVTADETAVRAQIQGQGALSNPVTQTFTSWDGHPSLLAFYDQAGTTDVKQRVNDLANSLVGAGAGMLAGSGGVGGPFKVQLQLVRRSAQAEIVLIALVPASAYTEPGIFTVADAAGGSSLAQFGDANAVQCETFTPGTGKVDFLFVVDDSCSMASSQTALAQAATAMESALGNSTLDWRIAMVTSEYHRTSGQNANVLRGWTTDINQFKAWLTQNSTCSNNVCTNVPGATPACGNWGGSSGGCWVGLGGSGSEGVLGAGRKATNDISPTGPKPQLRPDADLVLVLLGDADDQTTGYQSTSSGGSWENVQNFINFFTCTSTTPNQSTCNALQKNIRVHGIVCPAGQNCENETQANPQRHAQVITATGGIRGDIPTQSSIQATISAIVNSAIAGSGYKTQKPPIGASVKLAMDSVANPATCNPNNIPRSRVNGFDFNGLTGTISLFGDCRPTAATQKAAVSYRYWIDTTPNADGNPPPCQNDPFYDPADPDLCQGNLVCNKVQSVCECPANCGGTAPPGTVCNPNKLVCDFVCTADCGGTCSGYQTCDQTSCGCTCVQNATCAPGFTFINDGTQCGCFCDTAALNCGDTFNADPNACACVCKPDCGGCAAGTSCNATLCACTGGIG